MASTDCLLAGEGAGTAAPAGRIDRYPKLVYLALGDCGRAAALQLHLGRKLIRHLLIRALGLLNLSIGDGKLGLCQCEFGIRLNDTAPGCFLRRLPPARCPA